MVVSGGDFAEGFAGGGGLDVFGFLAVFDVGFGAGVGGFVGVGIGLAVQGAFGGVEEFDGFGCGGGG